MTLDQHQVPFGLIDSRPERIFLLWDKTIHNNVSQPLEYEGGRTESVSTLNFDQRRKLVKRLFHMRKNLETYDTVTIRWLPSITRHLPIKNLDIQALHTEAISVALLSNSFHQSSETHALLMAAILVPRFYVPRDGQYAIKGVTRISN